MRHAMRQTEVKRIVAETHRRKGSQEPKALACKVCGRMYPQKQMAQSQNHHNAVCQACFPEYVRRLEGFYDAQY